jgi:hypothetical protein
MIRFLIKIGYLEGKLHTRKRVREEIRSDFFKNLYTGMFVDAENGHTLNISGRLR